MTILCGVYWPKGISNSELYTPLNKEEKMDVDRTKEHRQDNTGTSKEAEQFLDRKLLEEDLACRSSSR